MIFKDCPIAGAYVIEPEKISGHRGFFARIWCQDELKKNGA
jgi:dTDP-4-dehydrorhamnose 3,5-epimerase